MQTGSHGRGEIGFSNYMIQTLMHEGFSDRKGLSLSGPPQVDTEINVQLNYRTMTFDMPGILSSRPPVVSTRHTRRLSEILRSKHPYAKQKTQFQAMSTPFFQNGILVCLAGHIPATIFMYMAM